MDPNFEKAEEDARRAYSTEAWSNLLPQERSKAIYRELRRIDMASVRAVSTSQSRIAGGLVSDRDDAQSPPTATILGVVGASIPVLPENADIETDDVGEIRALQHRHAAAFNAKDVNAIMTAYVPDDTLVVFDAASPRQYVGAKAYQKDREKFFSIFNGPLKFKISALNVATDGARWASATASNMLARQTPGGSQLTLRSGSLMCAARSKKTGWSCTSMFRSQLILIREDRPCQPSRSEQPPTTIAPLRSIVGWTYLQPSS